MHLIRETLPPPQPPETEPVTLQEQKCEIIHLATIKMNCLINCFQRINVNKIHKSQKLITQWHVINLNANLFHSPKMGFASYPLPVRLDACARNKTTPKKRATKQHNTIYSKNPSEHGRCEHTQSTILAPFIRSFIWSTRSVVCLRLPLPFCPTHTRWLFSKTVNSSRKRHLM